MSVNTVHLEFFREKRSFNDAWQSLSLSDYDATEDLNRKTGGYVPMILRYQNEKKRYIVCCNCGKSITQNGTCGLSPFSCCSSRCATFVVQKHKKHARRVTTPTHFISPIELFFKDKGICGICSGDVEISNASIDHIVALSKGGTHTWDNVQLAHFKCNIIKSDKEMQSLQGPDRFIHGEYLHYLKQEEVEQETEVIGSCP